MELRTALRASADIYAIPQCPAPPFLSRPASLPITQHFTRHLSDQCKERAEKADFFFPLQAQPLGAQPSPCQPRGAAPAERCPPGSHPAAAAVPEQPLPGDGTASTEKQRGAVRCGGRGRSKRSPSLFVFFLLSRRRC